MFRLGVQRNAENIGFASTGASLLTPYGMALLAEWFPGEPDMAAMIQEWFGYCLIPDTRQHKAMLLVGDGGNGKSVLCEVLKLLVGNQNVSCVSLNALGRSFALAELYGKLVNLTIEANVKEGIEEENFKAIVAGDPIQAERKFQHPFVFKPFARFTIAMNGLFHVDDRSDGFYRRLLIVRFERKFEEAVQDRGLGDKLKTELPGVLNWALAGLARLEERGRFLVPQRVLDEVADYKRQNNPVLAWAEESCELGDPLAWESGADLFKSYKAWAADNGHRPLARNKFGIELKRLKGVEARQHPAEHLRTRGFGGIRLCVACLN
jgi:putative DNA primase/helicase